jgi:hypothetical protein
MKLKVSDRKSNNKRRSRERNKKKKKKPPEFECSLFSLDLENLY